MDWNVGMLDENYDTTRPTGSTTGVIDSGVLLQQRLRIFTQHTLKRVYNSLTCVRSV